MELSHINNFNSTIINIKINNEYSDNFTIINVSRKKKKLKNLKGVDFTEGVGVFFCSERNEKQYNLKSSKNNKSIRDSSFIYVPSKAESLINLRLKKLYLKQVHKDKDTAVDLIMIFLSFLSDTYFREIENNGVVKKLSSIFLKNTFQRLSNYKSIINVLEIPFKFGSLIERDNFYVVGLKSYGFKLGDSYRGKGLVRYYFRTENAKKLYSDYLSKVYSKSQNNPIINNLLKIYPKLKLPTKEEIINQAKQLIKSGYTNRKGYLLSFAHNRSRDVKKNILKVYVEDSLFRYNYLTSEGLRLPIEGGVNSGGRICDSITLMDSWIRKLIKIDEEEICECDYTCLHPNIAISIYGGNKKYISHEFVANELNIDLKLIKREHLSFFNKPLVKQKLFNDTIGGMNDSLLYDFYIRNEPEMMENIIRDKQTNSYIITTKKMFSLEVKIMSSVISELNGLGIFVLYVYDALYCRKSDCNVVQKVMNRVVLEFGVYTNVKIKDWGSN